MQFLKASNSSFLGQNKDLTMGIYGTRIKERNKSKAFGQTDSKLNEDNPAILVKKYDKTSKFDDLKSYKNKISNF
jgi:hypothetical protein